MIQFANWYYLFLIPLVFFLFFFSPENCACPQANRMLKKHGCQNIALANPVCRNKINLLLDIGVLIF